MNKLQSDGKSRREGWRTELPKAGLGMEVLEKMRDEKRNDVIWQGKCSGTVYVSNCATFNVKCCPVSYFISGIIFRYLNSIFSHRRAK